MSRKYNSTTNAKCIYNPKILNLKSTSQRININDIPYEHNLKNNNIQDQKSNGNISLDNNLMNYSKNDKSSNLKPNSINDDTSLDNISNIISQKQNNLPNTQILFDDNESQIIANSNQTKNKNNFKTLKSFSNNNFSNNNKNIEVCDSHTKSFQLKMKKMKEMNKAILKENYNIKNKTFNDSKNGGKDSNNDLLNDYINSKSIINCKQKIIYMKNKNKLLNKGNIIVNDTQYNNGSFNFNSYNSDNDKKMEEEDKTIPFLCCFSKS